MERSVLQTITGNRAVDGAGVHLVRVLDNRTVYDFDPFLMLDAFDSKDPKDYIKGFPWHPHRGIETVTYLVSGLMEHQDSLGNKGDIQDGCCQWMTAGSGIMHQEMPQPSERMLGLQLWLNLPKKDKMTAPKYNDIRDHQVPLVKTEGGQVRVLSGHYEGQPGVMMGEHVKMTMLDVQLDAGKSFTMKTPKEETLFVYLMAGSGLFGKQQQAVSEKHAVLFDAGDSVSFTAGEEGLHLVLFMGAPLKEPIAWGGPVVMNTREELRQAFQDLDQNTFIKR